MLDYIEAEKLFKRARNSERGKVLAKATTLRKDGDNFVIQYWDTDVVSITSKNTYILKNDGFLTPTTKSRINEYSPARLFQKNKVWYVGSKEFFDGIEIDCEGKVLNGLSESIEIENEKKRKILNKQIKDYIDGFCDYIENNEIENPGGDDCWFCSMATSEGDDLGKTSDNYDHIFSHFKEKYFVPSLLWNAIKSQNYANPGDIWSMITQGHKNVDIARRSLRYYFKNIFQQLFQTV